MTNTIYFVNLFRVTATDAVLKRITLLDTSRCYGFTQFVVVTVNFTSFRRSQRCSCVVREVVCFECDKTVVVNSGNGFDIAIVADEPNRNGVNVFAILQYVRNGDGYVNIFTEIGDLVIFGIGNGKVIDGVGADLGEFFIIQMKFFLFVFVERSGTDGNIVLRLVTNAICRFTKIDVGSTNREFGILQILGFICLIFCYDGDGLGSTAGTTGVGSLSVNNRTCYPTVTKGCINGNGLLFGFTAISASKNLRTLGLTSSRILNACSILLVLFNLITYYVSTAICASIVLNKEAGFAVNGNERGSNIGNVVCNGSANVFGVGIFAVCTLISVGRRVCTGSSRTAQKCIAMSFCTICCTANGTNLICRTGRYIDVPTMAVCYIVTCVRMTAVLVLASISGIALFGTSGVSNRRLITMIGSRDGYGSCCTTTIILTSLCLLTGNGTGGSGKNFTVYPTVT